MNWGQSVGSGGTPAIWGVGIPVQLGLLISFSRIGSDFPLISILSQNKSELSWGMVRLPTNFSSNFDVANIGKQRRTCDLTNFNDSITLDDGRPKAGILKRPQSHESSSRQTLIAGYVPVVIG